MAQMVEQAVREAVDNDGHPLTEKFALTVAASAALQSNKTITLATLATLLTASPAATVRKIKEITVYIPGASEGAYVDFFRSDSDITSLDQTSPKYIGSCYFYANPVILKLNKIYDETTLRCNILTGNAATTTVYFVVGYVWK